MSEMSEIPDYFTATNTAYEFLIAQKEFSFPISVFGMISRMNNVRLHTFSQLIEKGLTLHDIYTELVTPSEHGFTAGLKSSNNYIIYYNDLKDETTIRFTLAHELGHILLGHKKDGEKEKKEANCFARNLLCPIPAVEGFKAVTINEYQQYFFVSETMADVAKNHVGSDKYYITNQNYNNYNDHVICDLYGISMAELYGLPKEYNELFA